MRAVLGTTLSNAIVVAVTAVAIVGIAVDNGSFDLPARASIAILVWWAIAVGIAVGLWPRARPPTVALVAGGLLLTYAGVVAASAVWAASAERVVREFDRAMLYAGVFALVVLASRRCAAVRWLDGLGFGIAAVGVISLTSRFFHEHFEDVTLPGPIELASNRLAYPIGYWNGLGILLGLSLPMLLRLASAADSGITRAVAVAPIPALAAAISLTSSRGGAGTALVGAVALLVVTPLRWQAAWALVVAAGGSAAAVAVVLSRDALADGPLGTPAAVAQGHSAALWTLVVCAVTAIVHGRTTALVGRRTPPAVLGRALAISAALFAVVAVAVADPVARLDAFRAEPVPSAAADGRLTREHFLSGGGSGRWQMWSAAARQFEERPLLGHGAGSFASWWAEEGDLPLPVQDAHSLYLETLGELGLVGFLPLAGAFVAAGFAFVRRRFDAGDEDTHTGVAAAFAAFLAFAFGAAFDWIWELTVIGIVGAVLLGLLTGPATQNDWTPVRTDPTPNITVRVSVVAVALLAMVGQAVPLLAESELESSRASVRRGDLVEAAAGAARARAIEPWAASPYLQLGLVEEKAGRIERARRFVREAIARDPKDWRLWLVLTRVNTKQGDIEGARKSLQTARKLNPRSPVLRSGVSDA